MESRRLSDGRVVQRQVLYRGEINDSQREAWRKTIEVQDEVQDEGQRRQVSLLPAQSLPTDAVNAMGVQLNELRLQRPRQCGACWLACTPWLLVLQTSIAYRLIDPGSEWRLHRQWFDASAMADLTSTYFETDVERSP